MKASKKSDEPKGVEKVVESKECPRCGDPLHAAEPDIGIMSAGCGSCHWFEGCEST